MTVDDPALTRYLVRACERFTAGSNDDRVLAEESLRALANQMFWGADETMPVVIRCLQSPDESLRIVAATALISDSPGEDVFLPSIKLKSELYRALRTCADSDSPELTALAWAAMFWLYHLMASHISRDELWDLVSNGTPHEVEQFLNFMEMHFWNVESLFSDATDISRLVAMHGKYNAQIDKSIIGAVDGIPQPQVLSFLAQAGITPSSWLIHDVLRNICVNGIEEPYFSDMVGMEVDGLPEYCPSESSAFLLIAKYIYGKMSLADCIRQLPSVYTGIYSSAEEDRELLEQIIKGLSKECLPDEKRKLKKVLAALKWRDEDSD